ncbi:putative C6 finger domain protein [Aspergillus avenaceus]|uniref:Putative C6 finger domain protein n=1 Tax=Aspergillus avenaceus TaxID=36643 RepID=A0A5N6TQT9_ASPAV|nr:putative C6 finger domain protein [Aspergillus avenaceus]
MTACRRSYTAHDTVRPLKSRRGCKTCKIRRVKCGEERPDCQRCTSTGRKCEYETPATSYTFASAPPTVSILDNPLSSSPNTVWRERRAFAYYFQHAARCLTSGLDVDFWAGVIPQICRSEPAVWDAINAISALYEFPEQCLDPVFLRRRKEDFHSFNQNQKEALTWYSRSLSSIRTQIDRGNASPYVALITCVLYICIETIQGRVEEALQLYQQGVDLIFRLRAQADFNAIPDANTTLLENTIIPIFVRLGTVALSISGVPASGLFHGLQPSAENKFTSIHAARLAIVPVVAEGMLFQRMAQMHLLEARDNLVQRGELIGKQTALQVQLAQWRYTYDDFVRTFDREGTHLDKGAAASLLVYHAATRVIVSTSLSQDECIFDSHLQDFQVIVHQATVALEVSAGPDGTQPPFTFEMGVGLPLFLTVMKCRYLSLRRRAFDLLQKAPKVQGFYKCSPGAAIVDKIMQLEEENRRSLVEESRTRSNLDTITPSTGDKYNGESTGHSDLSYNNPIIKHGHSKDPSHISDVELVYADIPVPEKARIIFIGIFRPANGLPPNVSQREIAKWERSPDQTFMAYIRHRLDPVSETWSLAEEYVPIDC